MDFHRGLVEIPLSVCQTGCTNDWAVWRPMGNSNVDVCMCGWMAVQMDKFLMFSFFHAISPLWVQNAVGYCISLSHTSVVKPVYNENKTGDITGLQGSFISLQTGLWALCKITVLVNTDTSAAYLSSLKENLQLKCIYIYTYIIYIFSTGNKYIYLFNKL